MIINYLKSTFVQSCLLVILIVFSAIFDVLGMNMSITSKTLFKAIYWLYIVYYLAFVYVPYLKNKKEDKV